MTNTFKGPTVMYGPSGEFEVFQDSAAVPAGWLDNPAKFSEKPAPAPKTGADSLPMTRDEIITALKAGNVQFKGNAGTAALYTALTDALKGHLEAQEIAFPADATAPDMLKLLEVSPQA